MKIPADVSSHFLIGGDNKAFAEQKGAPPVYGSDVLQSTLSRALAKQQQARKKVITSAEEKADDLQQGQNGRRNRDQPGAEKRLQPDRRKQQLPILIDARVTPSRRKSDQHVAINVKI